MTKAIQDLHVKLNALRGRHVALTQEATAVHDECMRIIGKIELLNEQANGSGDDDSCSD